MQKIQMVDLSTQYLNIKSAIDKAIIECIESTAFINGPQVAEFTENLSKYIQAKVITCANGTDALQIALMSLELNKGDEIILPSFTYVATAEVIGLLGLVPVMIDVDPDTFNIDVSQIEKAISPRTRAIVPVHLFGQCADMDAIMNIAHQHKLYVIEDVAQAIGAYYNFPDGIKKVAGSIGTIGCTSFFPSKNLGCYGDGGALLTNTPNLADKIRMIANHGQVKKYIHKYIGVNSRLDSIQAAILNIKLSYLDEYTKARVKAADYYDEKLIHVQEITIPKRSANSSHVFHQYTIKVNNSQRDGLKNYLAEKGIPSMIYYPIPLNEQEAFRSIGKAVGNLEVTKKLCKSVLSLPMHTELTSIQQDIVINAIKSYFSQN